MSITGGAGVARLALAIAVAIVAAIAGTSTGCASGSGEPEAASSAGPSVSTVAIPSEGTATTPPTNTAATASRRAPVNVPVRESALPRHPFPRWVQALEAGTTTREEVAARFGEPVELRGDAGGGQIWRYARAEIHWPPDDPMRPVVAADGSVGPPEPGPGAWVANGYKALLDWIDWVLFYPPRQPRPPRQRPLPATIHHLELRFDAAGTLRSLRYAPELREALVPAPG